VIKFGNGGRLCESLSTVRERAAVNIAAHAMMKAGEMAGVAYLSLTWTKLLSDVGSQVIDR
jgi:hypothetical protein